MSSTLAITVSKTGIIFHFDKIAAKCYNQGVNIIQYLKDQKVDVVCQLTDKDRKSIEEACRAEYRIPPHMPIFTNVNDPPAVQERASSEEITPNTTPPTGPSRTNTGSSTSSRTSTSDTPTKRPRGRPPGIPNRDKNAPPPVKIPKKRGRPKNSKNKPKDPNAPPKVRKPKNAQPPSGGPATKQYSPAQEAQLMAAAQTPIPIRIAPVSNISATHQQEPAATDILNADQITALQDFNLNQIAVDIPIDPQLATMGPLPAATQQEPILENQPALAQAAQHPTPPPAPMPKPADHPAPAPALYYPPLPPVPTQAFHYPSPPQMPYYQPAPAPGLYYPPLPPAPTQAFHYPSPPQIPMQIPAYQPAYQPAPAQTQPTATTPQLDTDLLIDDFNFDDYINFDAARIEEGEKVDTAAAVEQGCMTYEEFERWNRLGAVLDETLMDMEVEMEMAQFGL